ncbi:hypothetical protein CUJ84_pRLN3000547 (plasmid) [Rhizobium leguminosarum]|uniref:Uncharacterized protein n=1 Tax=Rhizobium leguminosarum TaxID=384 RepID=A0A2K9ZHE5_RHILE|nr:hypothetical protein CUJ84_pRLN3000547 [Rhizobium leguminosarum]
MVKSTCAPESNNSPGSHRSRLFVTLSVFFLFWWGAAIDHPFSAYSSKGVDADPSTRAACAGDGPTGTQIKIRGD